MKIIEVVADKGYIESLNTLAAQHGVDYWQGPVGKDMRQEFRILVDDDICQSLLDSLQSILETSGSARILVLPVETSLPRREENDHGQPREKKKSDPIATREKLYDEVEKSARLNGVHLLLVFLSTVVAAIGLLEDNVAVIIGAMVIAPLLGPNIALALAAALGDNKLMWESLATNAAGLGLALILSIPIGLLWPSYLDSPELLARTDVGVDSIALALASGAAGALSLTTGASSVLVGVMVAVALLPPTATLGIMLGAGKLDLAGGAGFLLAVNIVCVNLSAKLVFLARGIKPRTWFEKKKARQSMATYIILWILALAVLLLVIFARR